MRFENSSVGGTGIPSARATSTACEKSSLPEALLFDKGREALICNLADLFAAWDQAIACERYIDAAELPVANATR